jgi:hypothetical protein
VSLHLFGCSGVYDGLVDTNTGKLNAVNLFLKILKK